VIKRLLIGGAFAAVVLVLVAAVTLPLWVHPLNEDQARALALSQSGLGRYKISAAHLQVTFDGRVSDSHGQLLYTVPGQRVVIGGQAWGQPAAFWVVELQSRTRPACMTARVVIDAGSHKVVLVSRRFLPCTQF
jgi:hypothetical protein